MIVPSVRSQISRFVCLSMFSPVSGPTGLRGHRRSPPLGCPKLLQRPGQLTRGGCLRQSNRSVWSGFRPDVCEGAWQHSSKRVANHSIRYGQNSSTKLGRQARAKTRPDRPARPARLRLARAGAPVLGAALDSRLLNNARKVRDRPGVDGRRLSLLPDFRQVSAGQDGQQAGCHTPSKPMPQRQANRAIGWAWNASELPLIGVLISRRAPHLET
jgi:hypothetical protein